MPQLLLNPTSISASTNTALNEALWLLERRLTAWSSNQNTSKMKGGEQDFFGQSGKRHETAKPP